MSAANRSDAKQVTIFTPTYNRLLTLGRVYQSLLGQTCHAFTWLIVDDGSSDNTDLLVQGWQNEGKLDIEYLYKEHGGKHTAMKAAIEKAQTPYFVEIDSDDALKHDAVECFLNEWCAIRDEGREAEFAEVSALTRLEDGTLVGNYALPANAEFVDSCWHEMVLKFKNYNEHIVCWDVNKLRECFYYPTDLWHEERVAHIGEIVFWARIGERYKTRYLNRCLREYYVDGGGSLMRSGDPERHLYSALASNLLFLDEQLRYFFWNPKYFVHLLLKLEVAVLELKESPGAAIRRMTSRRFKVAYALGFPAGVVAWAYFRYVRRKFWF